MLEGLLTFEGTQRHSEHDILDNESFSQKQPELLRLKTFLQQATLEEEKDDETYAERMHSISNKSPPQNNYEFLNLRQNELDALRCANCTSESLYDTLNANQKQMLFAIQINEMFTETQNWMNEMQQKSTEDDQNLTESENKLVQQIEEELKQMNSDGLSNKI